MRKGICSLVIDIKSPLERGAERDNDLVNQRVAKLNLVSWLAQGARNRPLDMSAEYPWCQKLRDLLLVDSDLGGLFVEDAGMLDFRPTVGDLERQEIRSYAAKNYRPVLLDS